MSTYYQKFVRPPWGKFTYQEFKKRFDTNVYELFYLLEFPLQDKISADMPNTAKRVRELQNLNRRLDADYYDNLEKNDPDRYNMIKHIYYGK